MTETIVAAAIAYEGVTLSLPQPAGHGEVMVACRLFIVETFRSREVQGFLTSTGRFVTRAEAMKIAHRAAQALRETPRGPELFSEDLW